MLGTTKFKKGKFSRKVENKKLTFCIKIKNCHLQLFFSKLNIDWKHINSVNRTKTIIKFWKFCPLVPNMVIPRVNQWFGITLAQIRALDQPLKNQNLSKNRNVLIALGSTAVLQNFWHNLPLKKKHC